MRMLKYHRVLFRLLKDLMGALNLPSHSFVWESNFKELDVAFPENLVEPISNVTSLPSRPFRPVRILISLDISSSSDSG